MAPLPSPGRRGPARGDLRVAAQVHGRDDLAQIAEALNAALVQLRGSLAGVNQESNQLGGTVLQLNAQAQDTLTSVEQQQGQVSQIAAAAHELAATAQSVAESCEGRPRMPSRPVRSPCRATSAAPAPEPACAN